MIAVAYNRRHPELVFIIDKVKNFRINNVQVPYYVGTLRDTSPVPDTDAKSEFKVRCQAFEIRWRMIPLDATGATDLNIQPSKTTTPTLSEQVITADKDYTGLGRVIVKATPVEERTVTPTLQVQTITPNSPAIAMTKVTVNAAPVSDLSVTPTASVQSFSPKSGECGYRNVTVAAAPTETKTVTPTTGTQTLSPSSGKVGFSRVTVNPVTSAIDSNIRPENIKAGVTILGVTGTYEGEE